MKKIYWFLLSTLTCSYSTYAATKDLSQDRSRSNSQSDTSESSEKSSQKTTKKEEKNNKKKEKNNVISEMEKESDSENASWERILEENMSSNDSRTSEEKALVKVFIDRGSFSILDRSMLDDYLTKNFTQISEAFINLCHSRNTVLIKRFCKESSVQDALLHCVEEQSVNFLKIGYVFGEHNLLYPHALNVTSFLTHNIKEKCLTQLQVLDLLNLHNIEFITFINATNLKELVLYDTPCSTQSLNELIFPELKTLGLDLSEFSTTGRTERLIPSNLKTLCISCPRHYGTTGQDAFSLKNIMYAAIKSKAPSVQKKMIEEPVQEKTLYFTTDSEPRAHGRISQILTQLWGSRVLALSNKYDIANMPI